MPARERLGNRTSATVAGADEHHSQSFQRPEFVNRNCALAQHLQAAADAFLDAARLARYGGVKELRNSAPHAIGALLFYAVTPEAEPADLGRVLVDVSAPAVMSAWTAAMEAHVSQVSVRNYVELQLTRARLHGLRGGVAHAIPLFPNEPPVLESLEPFGRAARRF